MSAIAITVLKKNFQIIKKHKSLLVVPFIHALLSLGLLYLIIKPFEHIEIKAFETNQISAYHYILFFIVLMVFFALLHFITIIKKSMMTIALYDYFKKNKIDWMHSIQQTAAHSMQLFLWFLFFTTGGLFIQQLDIWSDKWQQSSFFKNKLCGLRWFIATFLVIPMTVIENRSLLDAITHSSMTMKAKWGDVNKTNLNSIYFTAIRIVCLLPALLGLFMAKKFLVLGLTVSFVLLFVMHLLLMTSTMIISVACYLHAINDESVYQFYNETLLQQIFYFSKRR